MMESTESPEARLARAKSFIELLDRPLSEARFTELGEFGYPDREVLGEDPAGGWADALRTAQQRVAVDRWALLEWPLGQDPWKDFADCGDIVRQVTGRLSGAIGLVHSLWFALLGVMQLNLEFDHKPINAKITKLAESSAAYPDLEGDVLKELRRELVRTRASIFREIVRQGVPKLLVRRNGGQIVGAELLGNGDATLCAFRDSVDATIVVTLAKRFPEWTPIRGKDAKRIWRGTAAAEEATRAKRWDGRSGRPGVRGRLLDALGDLASSCLTTKDGVGTALRCELLSEGVHGAEPAHA